MILKHQHEEFTLLKIFEESVKKNIQLHDVIFHTKNKFQKTIFLYSLLPYTTWKKLNFYVYRKLQGHYTLSFSLNLITYNFQNIINIICMMYLQCISKIAYYDFKHYIPFLQYSISPVQRFIAIIGIGVKSNKKDILYLRGSHCNTPRNHQLSPPFSRHSPC